MATMSLIPPFCRGRVSRDYPIFNMCKSTANAGFSLLDVNIVALATKSVEMGYFEDGTTYHHDFFCVVVGPEEAERLRREAPIGYVVEPFWWPDTHEELYCIRICELFILNEWDRLRIDACSREDVDPETAWPYVTSEMIGQRWYKTRQALSLTNQREVMYTSFDISNDNDLDCRIIASAVKTSEYLNATQYVGISDNRYPVLSHRSPPRINSDTKVRLIVYAFEIAAEQMKGRPIGGFTSIGENHKVAAMARASKALDVFRAVADIEAPRSGRRIILDDDIPQFPAATRCNVGTKDAPSYVLAFSLDARRGSYSAPRNRKDEGKDGHFMNEDFFLIHRDVDCWRFLFVSYFTLHAHVMRSTRAAMIMPYIVTDKECVFKPSTPVVQRGMSLALAQAIRDTPYCASAISHALSRLKFVRSKVAVFNEVSGKDAKLHYPEYSLLFRTAPGYAPVAASTRRGASSKAISEHTHKAMKAIGELLAPLRPSKTVWATNDDKPITSVLGDAVQGPRPVSLDM